MSNTDGVNPKAAAKPKFNAYLSAVQTDRLSAANESKKEKPLLLSRRVTEPDYSTTNVRLLQATGVLVSAIWLAGAAFYVQRTVGWSNVSSLMPHELGGFLAGIFSPIALLWMIAAFVLRSNDVKMYAEALREEVQRMIFPSEETDRRVNNDIERLIRQTGEMSKATKIMLSTIAEAREGLKGQISALNNTSDQTLDRLGQLGKSMSERTSEVTFVGQTLDRTIKNIENGTKATSDWMDKLKVANEQIGKQTALVNQSTQNTEQAVTRLEDVLRERLEALTAQRESFHVETEHMQEKATAVASALSAGANKLFGFTDDALDKAKLIETRLQGHAASLEHVIKLTSAGAQEIEAKTVDAVARLDQVQSQALSRSEKLEQVLQQAIDRLSERSQQSAAATEKTVTGAVEHLMQRSHDAAQEAQKTIVEATSQLAEHTESAVQNAQKTLTDVTSQLTERTQSAVLRAQKELTDTTNHVTERSQFALHQAQNSLSDATTRMVGEIDQVSERAKTVSTDMLSEVNRKVADTSAAFVYIQKQIQALVTLFDQRKTDLDDAGSGARETAETLQKTLQVVLDKVRDTSQALQQSVAGVDAAIQKPIALLETSVSKVYLKAGDMGALLENKSNALAESAQKIGVNITALHDKLDGKGQDVALLAGKIAGHLQTVGKELDERNQTLDQRTAQSVKSLQDLGSLQDNLSLNVGKLAEQTQAAQQHIQTLQQSHTSLSDEALRSQGQLGQVSDRLINISGETVNKIKSTLENLTLLEADYHRLSDAGIENINRVGSSFRQTLEGLQSDTGKAHASLVSMEEQLREQAAKTSDNIEQNVAKITQSAGSLQGTAQALGRASEETSTKITRVQDLGQSVQLNLQRLSHAVGAFDNRVQQSNSNVTIHVGTLNDSIGKIENVTRQAVGTIIDKSHELEQQTDSHVMHLERSFDHASNFSTRLRDYLNELRTDSEGLEDKLAQSITRLLAQGQQIDVSTTGLVDKINQAQLELMQQGSTMQQTGDSLLVRLQTATDHIGSKASALEAAAHLAQKQADDLRTQEAKLKRDVFFSSTKFVVESLHSLALDFTRLLEGELPEKAWKSYQKGDTGSFTRRLLSARDEDTQNKIKTKYANDHEFRTYIQRYLRQFEEIYDQAVTNDHADLLTTIFMTSDVGKLYKFLCSVLERESRGADQTKLAA